MAKVIIAGNACVLLSSLALDDIKELRQNHPEALSLKDGMGQTILTIDLDQESAGRIKENQVVFGLTASREGKATITLLIDPEEKDIMGMIREKIGDSLMKLTELENKITGFLGKRAEADQPLKSEIVWL